MQVVNIPVCCGIMDTVPSFGDNTFGQSLNDAQGNSVLRSINNNSANNHSQNRIN